MLLDAEGLDGWIDLIDLLIENEPRFLRSVGFPEQHAGVIAKLFECLQRELLEDVEGEALSEVATNASGLAEKITKLSDLADYEPKAARALAAQLLGYSDTLRERARERDGEEREPPDDDDRRTKYSDSDIEALFSDL
ncbi:MAG TPA: hypothetical protein VNF29_02140 [Candidatus Binataceae bacterium]|nr:hypothetical protein [Candidatus Binataceae bacterium]